MVSNTHFVVCLWVCQDHLEIASNFQAEIIIYYLDVRSFEAQK